MVDKIRAAVLGATGLVGQRFVSLLASHPWFELVALTASSERAGKRYSDTVQWLLETPMPSNVAEITVAATSPDSVEGAEVVFVALPKEAAMEIELELARRGKIVVSNASNYRLEPDIPLLNPEANWEHIGLVEEQRRRRGWRGAILKVPNCSTAVLTLSLKPVLDRFGIRDVHVTTMQAISGAGLRGVPGYVIVDNIVPFIKNEEEKIINETRKVLGRLEDHTVKPLEVNIYATTTRVPVLDGHLESVHIVLGREPNNPEEVIEAFESWRPRPQELGLPTAPEKPVIVRREPDRPQPRLDRLNGGGMSVTVGRIRLSDRVLQYLVLGHNTIRGAAGTGVLIAELYYRINGLI